MMFRKSASRNEKAYTLFLYFLIGCLFYTGLTDFYFKTPLWDSTSAWVLVFVSASILLLPLFFDSNPSSKVPSFSLIKRLYTYAAFYMFYVIFSFNFICVFYPSIYTSVAGEPFDKIGKITNMTNSYQRRSCDTRIYLDLFKKKTCISKDFYSLVKVGDNVTVRGFESKFGFKLTAVSLVK